MLLSVSLPCFEQSGHELCFVSHPMFDRRLQCNAVFGNVTMDKNWEGWEVWRFIKKEDNTYIITSWTHDHRVLCSSPDGRVYTTQNKEGSWERWRILRHPIAPGLLIQSAEHGRYLAYHGQDLYLASNPEDDNGQRTAWHLEPGHRNQFFLSAADHDRRVSSCNNGTVFTSHNRQTWEKWVVQQTDNIGMFIIRSLEHGHFLGVNGEGHLRCSHQQDQWAIVSSPDGGVFLKSINRGHRNLACNDSGDLYLTEDSGWHGNRDWISEISVVFCSVCAAFCSICAAFCSISVVRVGKRQRIRANVFQRFCNLLRHFCSVVHGRLPFQSRLRYHPGGWETWRLEPIMPGTVSEKQIWSWVGIGTATIGPAVAAPFAVMGVVGAMGFGAGGIAAGSAAAGMMSAEAFAAGGAIAAGGTVATLQSVGAAGLGAAGMTAAVGTGATMGAATSVGIAAAANGLVAQVANTETPPVHADSLPLCAWRHW